MSDAEAERLKEALKIERRLADDEGERVNRLYRRVHAAESKLAAAEAERDEWRDGANDLSAVLAIRQNELAAAEAVIEVLRVWNNDWPSCDDTAIHDALAAYDRALSTTPEDRDD